MNSLPDKTTLHASKPRTGIAFRVRQAGFTLVEIAVSLAILGLALGTGITVLNARLTQAKIDTTKARVEGVRQALVAYVYKNYRLPCPAGPGLKQIDPGFNLEERDATGCTLTNGVVNVGTAPTNLTRGTVPCLTLGVPEAVCLDAYGTRLTYFVENSTTQLNIATVSGMAGNITVHNVDPPKPFTLNAASQISQGAAIIISHGANRGGGYAPSLTTPYPATPPDISVYEEANADANIQFVQNSYVESGSNSFDDVLALITPRELIASLSQVSTVRDSRVVMNERFATIKVAIFNQMFNAAPVALAPQGTVPDRGLRFAPGSSGPALAQVFPAPVAQTQYCPAPTSDTLQLPLATDVQPLSVLSGLRLDVWGTPIRYKLFATNGIAKPGICPGTGPSAHLCAPTPDITIRSGLCQTVFVLVSYGPNGIANTGAVTDDDIFYAVTNQEATDFVQKSGGW